MILRAFLRVTFLFTFIAATFKCDAQMTANFSATPLSGCAPLIVRFTDQSTGNPTSWRWDLGNRTISFLQNPSVLYFTPGKYTIKLVAKNSQGADSIIKSEYVEVFANPVIKFSVSDTTGCYPLPAQFTDLTTTASGTINSWLWDFGDGATSSFQNPDHTYTSAGNFSVTLQVKNTSGCVSTFTKPSMIQINTGVLAKFGTDNPQTCSPPVTINFQNQSTGTGAVHYLWSFGDASTSAFPNPSHTYTNPGSYTVSMIVTNSSGCTDTIVKPNAVTVGAVRAGFIIPNTACRNNDILFTNTSAPVPATVLWSFGDATSSAELSPVKAYAAAGTYSVKMVANFGACTDSVTKIVTVLPKPVADFTTNDTGSCKAPFTVNFTSLSANAASLTWDFGDSSTSTLSNPSHIYNSLGDFTVKLIVTSSNGCSDTLIKTNYISIKKPKATATNIPDSGCVAFTKSFELSTNAPEPVVSYLWNFGDGSTSASISPTHTYTAEGMFDVSVIIVTASGCTDTAIIKRGIVASNKPVPNFSADPTSTCAKTGITFTDLSTGGPTRWLWDFGDGSISTIKRPVHLYTDTGFFDVSLKIWKSGCADSIIIPQYIRINPPIANFSVKNDCKKPFEKIFTDLSIGADEWLWDFGDGTTSAVTNPTHIYASTGLYTVKLTVVNHTYGCDYTTIKQIQIINAKAQFTAADTSVCKGSTIDFTTGLSISDITTFNWYFGDGTSPVNSPGGANAISYVYTSTGTFSIRLIIVDKNGCIDTLIKPGYITVNGPVAKFTSAVPGACLNNAVIFNDSSATDGMHPLQQWTWDYNDGNAETLLSPPFQHTFLLPGAYTVKLKITDSKGCTDSSKSITPLIISKPKADFTTLDTFSCPGKLVRLVNQSTGANLTYKWSFGDNATSALQSPGHAYSQDGTYTVKLVITDIYGCTDSIIKTNFITITSPMANFTMSDSVGNCPPLIVHFTNLSGNVFGKKWDFGDSTFSSEIEPVHFYNYPGTYQVKLTITGQGGCTNTYQRKILIKGPEGHFSYDPLNGCNPVTVNFAAVTNGRNSFVWDFNDGSTSSGPDSVVSYTYTYPGKYVPKMILIDQAGCQVPIRGHDTIAVSGISANFGFTNKVLCDSGSIVFSDSSIASNDVITGYQWSFGDGGIASGQNPVHQYAATGIYYPSLIAKSQQGCADTLRSPVPLKIVASPKINIVASANGCTPLAVTFNSGLLVPDTSVISWRWNFGNGNISLAASPVSQNYITAGIYSIILIGTNSSGCKDSVTKNIEAYHIPVISAGTDVVLCKGSSLTLQATGGVAYSWSPATGLDCTNCPNPATNTPMDIDYIATGTSAQGCSASDTVAVKVKNKFVLKHSPNDSLCRGQSKNLSASGGHKYSWTPVSSLDNANISNPVATPDTNTIYRVIAVDELGCFKDTGYIPVRVNPIPTVEAGVDKTINVGQTTDLVPVVSPDVVNVNWQPTTGLFRNFYPGITVKPAENTEYTVEVKNKGGCMSRDRVTVFVICNGSNIFIPNTFSPNDDGTNDVFYPRGTGLFKVKSLRIFTRWGEMIFEKNNFDANNPAYGWDGANKGSKLNPDVFVYTLEVICNNGSVLTYRGNIALVK